MSKEWGNAYWDLFHTLSYKLKVDAKANELYNHFYTLSSILPCPICKKHAMEYLSKIKKNSIHNREALINLFFNFHNNVNEKLKKKQFSKEEFENLYSKKKIVDTLNQFSRIYFKNNINKGIDIDLLTRKQFFPNFVNFIKSNRHLFILD